MIASAGVLVRSMTNHDLGPGRVKSVDAGGRILVHFPWKGIRVHLDAGDARLERYELFGDVPIRCRLDGEGSAQDAVVLGRVANEDDGALWDYRVAVLGGDGGELAEAVVPETDLFPLPPTSPAPLDLLKALAWQGPKRLLRRWRLRLVESRWLEDSGGLPAFLGARIRPLGHQLYAARRVLWDRVPRFVLADEVGLGKTIETGLIIQSLAAENPDLSVLIVAPGSMARQWQTELYLRFGARAYAHVDSTTLSAAADGLLDRRQLVITTTALQTLPVAGEHLASRDWDLVVIDEAHQFPPASPLYGLFERLSRRSRGLLALSATPSKRQITSLCGLLALVAPDIYAPDDHEALARRLEMQREVWERLRFTRDLLDTGRSEHGGLDAEALEDLADEWDELLGDDPNVQAWVHELRAGRGAAGDALVAYVQEFHRLDHRIIRTRRSTLQGEAAHWSQRTLVPVDYPTDAYEAVLASHLEELPRSDTLTPAQRTLRGLYQRNFATTPTHLAAFLQARRDALDGGLRPAPPGNPLHLLTTDPGPADEEQLMDALLASTPELPGERDWLETALGLAGDWQAQGATPAGRLAAARDWLREHLRQSASHQVLVFAQDRPVVEELTTWLSSELAGIPVQCFHHGMDEKDLAQVALNFQRNHGCRVLVSDELGGEGRNFQNASAVLHFDLPWSVARLEQRIGRLDRVGRGAQRPVHSVVLCGPTGTERVLRDVHKEVFQVFTRSVGGLEYALPGLQRELNEALCHGAQAVRALHAQLAERVDQELQDVDEAFELALDASRLQLDDAQTLAELLADPDDWRDEGTTIAKWLGKAGLKTRRNADYSWELQWAEEDLQRPLPGLPESGFVAGTFDRERALADESQQFFGAGHTLIDATLNDLHRSAEGRATVMSLKLGPDYARRWFVLVLGRCDLDRERLVDTPTEAGLLLRARRFLWSEVQPALVELRPGEEPAALPVHDALLTAQLRSPDTVQAHYSKIPPNTLGNGVDTMALWAAVEEALPLALERIREQREGIADQAGEELSADLGPELGFLTWQAARAASPAQAAELEARARARQGLIEAVRHERIHIEALAVIFGLP
jgi:ATP-dependent helicase HepA